MLRLDSGGPQSEMQFNCNKFLGVNNVFPNFYFSVGGEGGDNFVNIINFKFLSDVLFTEYNCKKGRLKYYYLCYI